MRNPFVVVNVAAYDVTHIHARALERDADSPAFKNKNVWRAIISS